MKLIPYFGEGIASNSYLLVSGDDAVLIDCAVPAAVLQSELLRSGASLRYIVLTHGHFDHISSVDEIRLLTGAEVIVHEKDAEMLTDSIKNGYSDFFEGDFTALPADKTVSDGDVISAGDIAIKVIHTPGHSKGSMCLECEGYLFTGDTLFANNIGRSDLYGGSDITIMRSLGKLASMKPELEIYPGHGLASTIAGEVRSNYYIRDALQM